MRRGRLARAAVLVVLSGVACDRYFVTSDVASDAGRTDAGKLDAGPSDGGPFDAGTDAGGDASPGDSAPDAATKDAGGDASTSPCTTPPATSIFCDDFDQGALGATWDSVDTTFLGLDTLEPASPPRSLSAIFTPAGADHVGVLDKKLVGLGTSNVRIALDLRVDASTGNRPYPFGLLFTSDYKIAFTLDVNGVEESGTVQKTHPTGAPTIQGAAFTHVVMSVHRAGTVDLEIDGTAYLTSEPLMGGSTAAEADCHLRLGVFYGAAASSWNARIDNLLVTTF
jgi:hypothetical protein